MGIAWPDRGAAVTDSSSDQDLSVDIGDGVAVLTLLADARLNALRRSFWTSMRTALSLLEHDDTVRAIVIRGDGSRAFSAGGDIKEYGDLTEADNRRSFIVDCMRTFEAVQTCPKPVIAAVRGVAMGGGFELALACDVVVAGRNAQFALPEARLGLIPGFGIGKLTECVSPGWARYLVLSGDTIDGQRASDIGLVQLVVDDDAVVAEATALAQRIGQNAPLALAAGKNVIYNSSRNRSTFAVDAVVMLQGTDDAAEGVLSFQDRRRARFSGR